jgi:hypothetical protein
LFFVGYALYFAEYRVAAQAALSAAAVVIGLIVLPLRWKIVLSDQTLTYRAIRSQKIPRGAIREIRRVLSPNGTAFERFEVIGDNGAVLLNSTSLFDPADILRLQQAIAADQNATVPPAASAPTRIVI